MRYSKEMFFKDIIGPILLIFLNKSIARITFDSRLELVKHF